VIETDHAAPSTANHAWFVCKGEQQPTNLELEIRGHVHINEGVGVGLRVVTFVNGFLETVFEIAQSACTANPLALTHVPTPARNSCNVGISEIRIGNSLNVQVLEPDLENHALGDPGQ
jgi:hypothetical protein